ncbi:MAG: NAD-dependent epimerase/dehydratase family protein, partial [Chloroflexi bacterium]|nr:NAD-dependent epimerase/dehydratase family protein [Chloroflexota bacterium]
MSSPGLPQGSWVLVTGGAGFIGSHTADALLAAGHRVTIVDDLSTGNRANLPPEAAFYQGSITDAALETAFRTHTYVAVVHCAAQVKVVRSMQDPELDLRINVTATRRVLELSVRAGVPRFVFLSTGGVMYGETETAATEETLPQPSSFYAVHKYTAERYVELSGLSYGILRFANVYGPRQRADLEGGVVAVFQDRLRAGRPVEIFGTGEQARDFLYVGDAVGAILAALRSTRSGLWNVGTGHPTTVLQLLEAMSAVWG